MHRYGDGHAVGNAFSPNASLRSDASRDLQAFRRQISAVTQRLAEADTALRAFDANSVSSKASASSAFHNDDTPPAASQSPNYKRFQPRTLAVDSHNADRGAGKFFDESESADSDMYASTASKDDESWCHSVGGNDDAESTSGYTSASQDTVTQADMQNSILLLCDQVQDLRGKLVRLSTTHTTQHTQQHAQNSSSTSNCRLFFCTTPCRLSHSTCRRRTKTAMILNMRRH